MFISLMTGQTETTEIKMNMRNIITARSVPDKSVSDDFMNAVFGQLSEVSLTAPQESYFLH